MYMRQQNRLTTQSLILILTRCWNACNNHQQKSHSQSHSKPWTTRRHGGKPKSLFELHFVVLILMTKLKRWRTKLIMQLKNRFASLTQNAFGHWRHFENYLLPDWYPASWLRNIFFFEGNSEHVSLMAENKLAACNKTQVLDSRNFPGRKLHAWTHICAF